MSVIVIALGACAEPVSPFIDEQESQLENLSAILAAHPGDTDAVCADLQKYLVDNQERLMDARLTRKRLMDTMTEAQKAAFATKSSDRLTPVRQRIVTQVKTFAEPARIMHLARQLFL